MSICEVVEIVSSVDKRSCAAQVVSHVDGIGTDVPWFHDVRKFKSIAGWL